MPDATMSTRLFGVAQAAHAGPQVISITNRIPRRNNQRFAAKTSRTTHPQFFGQHIHIPAGPFELVHDSRTRLLEPQSGVAFH
jgi:hypothetical protein